MRSMDLWPGSILHSPDHKCGTCAEPPAPGRLPLQQTAAAKDTQYNTPSHTGQTQTQGQEKCLQALSELLYLYHPERTISKCDLFALSLLLCNLFRCFHL